MLNSKPILCLDFDGVIHSYSSGWKGADVIPDDPVLGVFEFLEEAVKYFDVQIFSSRTHREGGVLAMRGWLNKHYTNWMFNREPELREKYSSFTVDNISFPEVKPPAMITIDDRAITFTGEWPDVQELLGFRPWNKTVMRLAIAKCDLCKEPFNDYRNVTELGKWVFHPDCYEIALHRLTNFMNILLLPQAEFDKWLEDDGQ